MTAAILMISEALLLTMSSNTACVFVCLCMQVQPRDLQPLTFASHTYETFHLLMPLYGARCVLV